MQTLTTLEKQVLSVWEVNYDNAESNKNDNVCYDNVYDIAKTLGMDKKIIAGVVASLIKKELVENCQDESYRTGYDLLVLSDDGIDTVFDLKQKQEG